ncbi:MerR family transcriptional regulator [Streptoalloteichus hindustanus]|uniref:DNA-binding transcriptional regulator, MerR family n=1 Tax=Streptoalloteichus hindustanus TaxID=2017 RepID=A0A1M4Z053_STRHI|nr:MerR family transcriptional regulator [Streptoalloteichus hindustanus]SHF11453.1 DNA-binding transcriptional regulator, MerR family [Streptoalloteichus hindustanus]
MRDRADEGWKIGQLAERTGLTVRTLHHYDHLGLVRPSRRTSAGHRRYDEADVRRLYQVLALRQLGLPLESIGDVLAGTSSVEALLARHRSYLDQQLVAVRTLRAQVATTLAALRDAEGASVTDFLELIRKVTTVDDAVKKHFSDEQLATLAERREQLGEQAIKEVEASWPRLIARVQAAVDAGTDPASAEGRELGREWMGLLERFHGGDQGLKDSLYQMQAVNAEQIEATYGGPTRAQIEFISRATAANS